MKHPHLAVADRIAALVALEDGAVADCTVHKKQLQQQMVDPHISCVLKSLTSAS